MTTKMVQQTPCIVLYLHICRTYATYFEHPSRGSLKQLWNVERFRIVAL